VVKPSTQTKLASSSKTPVDVVDEELAMVGTSPHDTRAQEPNQTPLEKVRVPSKPASHWQLGAPLLLAGHDARSQLVLGPLASSPAALENPAPQGTQALLWTRSLAAHSIGAQEIALEAGALREAPDAQETTALAPENPGLHRSAQLDPWLRRTPDEHADEATPVGNANAAH
jgi:hypothetical protein